MFNTLKQIHKVLCILPLILISTFANAQLYTFNNYINPNSNISYSSNDYPDGGAEFYRSDNEALLSYMTPLNPNRGLEPGYGGKGHCLVFDTKGSINGSSNSINFKITNGGNNLRLRFYLKNIDGNDSMLLVVGGRYEKRIKFTRYADWTLFDFSIDSIASSIISNDIRFICYSDNGNSNYGIDELYIYDASNMVINNFKFTTINKKVYAGEVDFYSSRITINTNGALNPLNINRIVLSIPSGIDINKLHDVKLYKSVDKYLDVLMPLSAISNVDSNKLVIDLNDELINGENHYDLVYNLDKNSLEYSTYELKLDSISINNNVQFINLNSNSIFINDSLNTFNYKNINEPVYQNNSMPSGTNIYSRYLAIYTKNILKNYNLIEGNTINKIRINVITPPSIQTTGRLKIYIINSNDNYLNRGNIWSGIINGHSQPMQLVYDSNYTIQPVSGYITFELNKGFIYSGNSIYIAMEWEKTSNNSNQINFESHTSNSTNVISARGNSVWPSTLVNNNINPHKLWLISNKKTRDAKIESINIKSKLIPSSLNHPIYIHLSNSSNTKINDYKIKYSIKGTNSLLDSQIISLNTLERKKIIINYYPINKGLDTFSVMLENSSNSYENKNYIIDVNDSIICYQNSGNLYNQQTINDTITKNYIKYNYNNNYVITDLYLKTLNNQNLLNRTFNLFAIKHFNGKVNGIEFNRDTIKYNKIGSIFHIKLDPPVYIDSMSYLLWTSDLSKAKELETFECEYTNPSFSSTYASFITPNYLSYSETYSRIILETKVKKHIPININIAKVIEICLGDTLILRTGISNKKHRWYFENISPSNLLNSTDSIKLFKNGIYKLVIYEDDGSYADCEFEVRVLEKKQINLGIYSSTPQPTCINSKVQIDYSISENMDNMKFQWYINGHAVEGATSVRFISYTLKNNDTIRLKVSGSGCVVDTVVYSNLFIVSIKPYYPSIAINIIEPIDTIACIGELFMWKSVVTNALGDLQYNWFVNNKLVGINSTISVNNINEFDTVKLVVISSETCMQNGGRDTIYHIARKYIIDTTEVTADFNHYRIDDKTLKFINTSKNYTFSQILIQLSDTAFISTDSTFNYTFPEEGNYIVTVFSQNECGSAENQKQINTIQTGQITIQKPLEVYPNPANESICISLPTNSEHFDISLYDLNGRKLYSEKIMMPYLLKLSSFSEGIYYIQLNNDKENYRSKISIVR